MAFASGRNSLGICDRCGQQYGYSELKKEWTGFKVCLDCYEPKHPQLEPKRAVDEAIALRDARPARNEPLDVYVGSPADSAFLANGMQPYPLNKPLVGGIMLGSVTVAIT